jgi:hypothetical protein
MTSIKLENPAKCFEAAQWCYKEFQENEWEMWMTDFRGRYTFEFSRPEAAVWFALRWTE